jgi:hypothetical protein
VKKNQKGDTMSRKKKKEKKAQKRQIRRAKLNRTQETLNKILGSEQQEERIVPQAAVEEAVETPLKKSGRGRPKGSKNKLKETEEVPTETLSKKEEPIEATVEEWDEREHDDENEELIREAEGAKKRGRKPLILEDFREEKKRKASIDYSDDIVMTTPVYVCYNCGTRKNQSTNFRVISHELAICKVCDNKK